MVFFGYSGFKVVKVIGALVSGSAGAGRYGSHAPAEGDVLSTALFLVLYLALPLHLICVGLLMQRPYLPVPWPRIVWWSVVVSGVWLGSSFLIRKFG
jgi:hypothetical protein